MKRKSAALVAVLAALAVTVGGSANARVAKPCTAANGSPMSKSLAICVGQIASFKGRPGGLVKVTIMLSSMTGRSVANVRVVDIMPKNIKPLRSTRRYKLVKGRPTWVVPMVTVGPLFYTFTARTPKTAKPGSRWYNVVTASVTGQKAVSRSGPSLVQYISAPGA